MEKILNSFFKLDANKTTVATECRAGLSTFLAMAYIIVVNPTILRMAGFPFEGVMFATIITAAISTIVMGVYANLPLAMASGMGINAFITFGVCHGMRTDWKVALGMIVIYGGVTLLITLTRAKEIIVIAIPKNVRAAVAAGIGLFLAFIGLKEGQLVVASPATIVTAGTLSPLMILFILGLVITTLLIIKRVKGALIYGIVSTSLISFLWSLIAPKFGQAAIVTAPQGVFSLPSMDTFWQFDFRGALNPIYILPMISLLFTDLFDSVATFVGAAEAGGFIEKDGQPKNVGKAMVADSLGTFMSGLLGTSSSTTYVESIAGIEEGGRTGLTAVVTGLLFLPFMFLSPLLAFVPSIATAPILFIVGLYMMTPVLHIDWKDFEEAIPAFAALITIPLTYSITTGIIWGFLLYTLIKIFVGKVKQIHWMMWIINLFAIFSLVSK